ncbi:twin-arginine translocase subunit TatC [uncultured Slackia sp.]|uniref:twin-arginine translocase subunit TatC n=1 Tax=uncultured Slackia sp. TaxID=665903 RepID=UPI0025F39F1A|nr:twin-arginine translocase subunit TatC [uncultured Slackia sp.]
MPIGPARMPLFDHLGELRMRLVRIVAALFIAMCVFYPATPTIIQFLLQPAAEYLPHDDAGLIALNIFDVFGFFTVRFKVALWSAVVATAPIILWQVLAFFLPALKPNERKWFIPTFAAGVTLFIAGTVFCYLFILNPAVQWLTEQGAGFAQVFPDAKAWIDVFINFEIAFGFAFELPLIVFYLVIFEIIPYAKLRESWRTVYIVLMVISAMVTLDASPITMLLMFAAMVVLYEASLLIARLVLGKRVKQQKEEAEREAREEAEWQEEWAATKDKIKKRLDSDED